MRAVLTRRRLLLPLLGGLLLSGPGVSSGAAQEAPEPGSELTVFLVTMGQGNLVWEKFGHNGIWIHDALLGTDRVYNYGLFDFQSPGYWSRFLQGRWIYEVGVSSIDETIAQYRYFNRSVRVQELNLTAPQKQELQDFLEWNARPENREYRYDYYRDNCSTRIRDVLNRALGGRLREATERVPTATTYRWHSERLIADDKLSYTGLLAGLGPAADRPISAWEEMFLPFKLEEQLRTIRVPDGAGGEAPLVIAEHTFYEAEGRTPPRSEPPFWLPWYLSVGALLGGTLAALAAAAVRSRLAGGVFVFAGMGWSLLTGIAGLLLVALWTLTDHQIAYRNENLLQFNPLSLGLVVLIPALFARAGWASRAARLLAWGVAGISVVG
ncbi:MAG: DUF4105 domain-containing protein, partial [Gemmatimonadota bacterium]|nr:DUF4105 domain-containing protein [Gemmatimonadota bacterium]